MQGLMALISHIKEKKTDRHGGHGHFSHCPSPCHSFSFFLFLLPLPRLLTLSCSEQFLIYWCPKITYRNGHIWALESGPMVLLLCQSNRSRMSTCGTKRWTCSATATVRRASVVERWLSCPKTKGDAWLLQPLSSQEAEILTFYSSKARCMQPLPTLQRYSRAYAGTK